MDRDEIEKIEIELFLEAVYQRYGYDFRSYARATVNRRIRLMLSESGCDTIMGMAEKVLHDSSFFSRVLDYLSITVSDMFRDPLFYCALREKVIPFLKTFPYIKIWHAGCGLGEEFYSLAIALQEEGLYERSTIFVTDINDSALESAEHGIYPIDRIKEFTLNYQKASGKKSFSDYYHAKYDSAIMNESLRKNVTFANHNLVIDSVFSEVHLILCRNVLIYFNKELQNRVLKLFSDSLIYDGFLCLGSKETLDFSSVRQCFKDLDDKNRIYQFNDVC